MFPNWTVFKPATVFMVCARPTLAAVRANSIRDNLNLIDDFLFALQGIRIAGLQ
jgi:hypothetical protein